MKEELFNSFNQICSMAKEIDELPDLTKEQYARIFQHVSNSDMETTIRTLRYAFHMIKEEVC